MEKHQSNAAAAVAVADVAVDVVAADAAVAIADVAVTLDAVVVVAVAAVFVVVVVIVVVVVDVVAAISPFMRRLQKIGIDFFVAQKLKHFQVLIFCFIRFLKKSIRCKVMKAAMLLLLLLL